MTIRKRNRGQIPSDLGWLVDLLDDFETRLEGVERPSGSQRAGTTDSVERTVAYLASLITVADNGAAPLSTGTVANDNVVHWFATSPDTTVTLDCPTGKLLVTASCGEASITPGGDFVVAYVSYSVRDANNVVIPGAGLGAKDGRRYTSIREGIGLTTNQQLVIIPDPVAYPGPYKVRAFYGMWVGPSNTTPASCLFQSQSLVVQVIGDGVPSA